MCRVVPLHKSILFYADLNSNSFLQFPKTCISCETKLIPFSLSHYSSYWNHLLFLSPGTLGQIYRGGKWKTIKTLPKSMASPCLSSRAKCPSRLQFPRNLFNWPAPLCFSFWTYPVFILNILIIFCSFMSIRTPLRISFIHRSAHQILFQIHLLTRI